MELRSIKRCWPWLIYIPRCFYFIICVMIGGLTASQFTFHYASTLSWESYDPFTGVWEIYIPLCFYFMGKDHGRAVSEDKFTFHYASTLCIKTGCIILITAFTFHYASTLSDTDLTPEQITELNLHSTMLLLYRRRKAALRDTMNIYIPLCFYFIAGQSSTGSWIRCIYIPLCFYFICAAGYNHRENRTFTFHYASTLSERD